MSKQILSLLPTSSLVLLEIGSLLRKQYFHNQNEESSGGNMSSSKATVKSQQKDAAVWQGWVWAQVQSRLHWPVPWTETTAWGRPTGFLIMIQKQNVIMLQIFNYLLYKGKSYFLCLLSAQKLNMHTSTQKTHQNTTPCYRQGCMARIDFSWSWSDHQGRLREEILCVDWTQVLELQGFLVSSSEIPLGILPRLTEDIFAHLNCCLHLPMWLTASLHKCGFPLLFL